MMARRALLALLLLALAPAAIRAAQGPPAVPPPAEQLTANCVAPVFASDQLVCADPELRALDDQLRKILAVRAGMQGEGLAESDYQWFLRRSRCAFQEAHRACLLQAYQERLALLQAATQSIGRTLRPAASLWPAAIGAADCSHNRLRILSGVTGSGDRMTTRRSPSLW